MTDYISRADALEVVKYCHNPYKGIRELAAADVSEVVRCAKCIWGYRDLICVNPKCGKSFYGCPVPAEHFCSYGERKTTK